MASHDDQETEIRRKFLRRSSSLPFYLRERFPENFQTVDDSPIPTFFNVDMIVGDASAARGSNRDYTAFQLCLEFGKKEDLTKCEEQRAMYYIGGICCLMPEVTCDIQEGLLQIGTKARTVRVPPGPSPNGLMIPCKKSNAFFGYLVIMLYKNVTVSNFGDLSDRNLKEVFDAAGYVPRQGEDVSVFNVSRHAMKYRSCGQFGRIKESVLKGILNHSKVKDSFDSPVLKACELANEVENLRRAVEVVFDSEMPQYFRILENRFKHYMVQRSKFPKLIAIVKKIMMKTTHFNPRFSASWVDSLL